MALEELKQAYRSADEVGISDAERIKRIIKFKSILARHSDPSFDEFHYELLRNRKNRLLYQTTRGEFAKRPDAEKFLLEKMIMEESPEMQADILQIMGHIRSPHASRMAKEFLEHEDVHHRKVALFVLGWVGTKEDIPLLQKHMLSEDDTDLRITAASAHRQIAWHYKDSKDVVLRSLKVGFETEKSEEVLPWIIVMIGTIAVKNLGLREDKDDPDKLIGDIEKAKKRTIAFLKAI